MNGNRSLVIIGLCSVVACERTPGAGSERQACEDRRVTAATQAEPKPVVAETLATAPRTPTAPPPRPPKPAIAVPRATDAEPPSPKRVPRARPARADVVDPASALPTPPSDDPKEYATWLAHLTRAQQARIATFCRANPLSYEAECGGIGPLHIPLPPHQRAMKTPPGPESRFASMKSWDQTLTPAQRRYVERQCRGGDDRQSSDLCGDSTPLVVAFDNQPVAFTSGGTFAFQPGDPVPSDWPTAKTPWIAIDLDHDGAIRSGAELFGSSTVLPDGTTARNGFAALAALDANHDGCIDARDPAFGSLLLWADRNGDHLSSPDELTTLSGVIVSISLDDHVEVRCDARANCERERAALTWRDAKGELHDGSVVDVYLPRR